MSIFVQPTIAPAARTKDATKIALLYAVILVIMSVAQLFSFDEFLPLFTSFDLPGGVQFAHFIAAFLVVAEVFALPFLLRMRVSTAFRWLSMILGWCVAIIWIGITVWLVTSGSVIDNVGLLGTVVHLMPGWWAIFISIAFGILATWSSWGMWPRMRHTKNVVSP